MSGSPRSEKPRPALGQSMALLTDLMEHPLDRSYKDRADARAKRGEARSAGTRSPLLVSACLALGLLLVLAAQTLRVPEETASKQRQELIGQIKSQQQTISKSQTTIGSLRGQIATLRAQAVKDSGGSGLAARLGRAEVASGAVAVRGPGMIMTLDDRHNAARSDSNDPRTGGSGSTVLTSTDLQVIVNGLWQAGAEAISINGHRLTALSAIRFAGEAILVDFRPLARPYSVRAIGEEGGLRERFEKGSGGRYLASLKDPLNVNEQVQAQDTIEVPASDTVGLRQAKVKESS